ncbi:Hydrophobin-1 [Cladobotryum mycophilum]|uniref:Hydrophobin-1 n=1 Tax=Cladobotryum mycophilum TaxID=491253 RepID=A0ABR0T3D2_9HYPO
MKFFAVAALFVAAAIAQPTTIDEHWANTRSVPGKPCPDGLFSVPQCCATDVLGVLALDCHAPKRDCPDTGSLRQECAKVGQQARCCLLPVAGQALICQPPLH